MRLDRRKTFIGIIIAGVAAVLLFPPAIYFLGMSLGPPPPVPAARQLPPLMRDALWARAEGGRAEQLTPVSPISAARLFGCLAYEDFIDDAPGDAQRMASCQEHLPAIQGLEYLSRTHMRDNNVGTSFREGLSRFSTTVWMTHSWSKDEFLSTLAERGGFGSGFRGIDAAAQGYFDRTVADLTLAQAAMIAAFAADRRVDPWCDPETTAAMRRRVLDAMRRNNAIDDAALDAANRDELVFSPPPANHPPCAR